MYFNQGRNGWPIQNRRVQNNTIAQWERNVIARCRVLVALSAMISDNSPREYFWACLLCIMKRSLLLDFDIIVLEIRYDSATRWETKNHETKIVPSFSFNSIFQLKNWFRLSDFSGQFNYILNNCFTLSLAANPFESRSLKKKSPSGRKPIVWMDSELLFYCTGYRWLLAKI